MIHSVLISKPFIRKPRPKLNRNAVNNTGKLRLSKFYNPPPRVEHSDCNSTSSSSSTSVARSEFGQHLFKLIGHRSDSLCNFVDVPHTNLRVIYRHYATLFFIFVVDEAESELGILDLIQVISNSCLRDSY